MTILLAGISATCFTASYLVALGLEVSRIYFSSRVRSLVMLLFGAAGLLAHTLYLLHRATGSQASPLSSPYDFYLLAAWALALLYLVLYLNSRTTAMGMFVLPLVLVLIGAAQLADEEPFAAHRASRFWGNVHGTFLLLGTVAVMVGFVVGLVYLVQNYRVKHKRLPVQRLRLPSLEWLEKTNGRALLASVLLIGVGFLSGLNLNLIKHGSIAWSEPVVAASALLFGWLLLAAGFNLSYRPAQRGRKVAYLTVANFVFLAVALALILLGNGQHAGGVG